MHRYYTVKDIAGMLKMDPQIIRIKCRKGHLPAIKAPGTRDWRIPISDMERGIKRKREKLRYRHCRNRRRVTGRSHRAIVVRIGAAIGRGRATRGDFVATTPLPIIISL